MSDATQGARDPYAHMSTAGMSKAELLAASPRIFDNPILDKLSRVPWWFPLLYLPFAAWIGWKGAMEQPAFVTVASLIFGYIAWTLSEYVFHRWLFHTEFPGKIGERIHFLLHGVHHVHPSDPLRLVMLSHRCSLVRPPVSRGIQSRGYAIAVKSRWTPA